MSYLSLENTHKTFYMFLNRCSHKGGTTHMWLFSKKTQEGILPPLPVPKAPAVKSDEIELIPEDLPEIPSEVPSLEFKKFRDYYQR